jgi:hypothetical protein
MLNNLIKIVGLFILFCSLNILAQDTTGQRTAEPQDRIIDLGEIQIDARVELPQVQILDKRIEPNFEDVRAEKSFQSELTGTPEFLKFNAITSGKVKPIPDIRALLDKKRF